VTDAPTHDGFEHSCKLRGTIGDEITFAGNLDKRLCSLQKVVG
jgi:hypothetical protein